MNLSLELKSTFEIDKDFEIFLSVEQLQIAVIGVTRALESAKSNIDPTGFDGPQIEIAMLKRLSVLSKLIQAHKYEGSDSSDTREAARKQLAELDRYKKNLSLAEQHRDIADIEQSIGDDPIMKHREIIRILDSETNDPAEILEKLLLDNGL